MANIKEYLNNILNAIYGKDVRQSIHDGIDAINEDVKESMNVSNETKTRQDLLEQKYEEQIENIASSEPQNAEIVDARGGFSTLGAIIKQKVYHFDTVSDMKNCLTLIPGDVVRTLGYYEENDGGTAVYQIVNDNSLIEDGGSVHALKNGLKAKLIIEHSVNVKQFGAKGDGVTDDTEAIQLAIDTYKEVFIPAGEFLVSSLNLNRKNSIDGLGKSVSILKSIDTMSPMILGELNSEGREEIIIKNICLNGDKKGHTGVKIYRTEGSTHDAWINIQNIAIKNFKEDGLYLGNYIRETYLDTIEIVSNGNCGLVLDEGATDNVITKVCSHNNENVGFYVNGANNRFNECKAFWNGRNNNAIQTNRLPGFLITSWCNKFVNCDAQENALHGFYIKNTNNIQILGVTSDRNGLPMTDWSSDSPDETYGSGIFIENSNLITVTGILRDFQKYQKGQTQKYGVYMSESKSCNFDLMVQDLEEAYKIEKSSDYILKINGNMYSTKASIISNVNNNNYIAMASETGRLGYDFFCDNAQFQIYSNNDNMFKIDSFKKDENGNFKWSGTPFYFKNDGAVHLGRYNTKIGFYDVDGVELQTINGKANDLNSAISLINSLKTSLINLGLIKEDY